MQKSNSALQTFGQAMVNLPSDSKFLTQIKV